MLAVFAMVCIGMILAMVSWRLLWASSPAPSPSSPEGEQLAAEAAAMDPVSEPREQGSGPVTSQRQVIQANYTVAPGDTLGSIASQHNTSIEALASMNNLENRNALRVGQRLIIP
jgi:LysM repeat protein